MSMNITTNDALLVAAEQLAAEGYVVATQIMRNAAAENARLKELLRECDETLALDTMKLDRTTAETTLERDLRLQAEYPEVSIEEARYLHPLPWEQGKERA